MAPAETAGGVMAELMEGVVLPTPRVPIAPENTSQLLSEALQAEKEAVQRGFESSAVCEWLRVPPPQQFSARGKARSFYFVIGCVRRWQQLM